MPLLTDVTGKIRKSGPNPVLSEAAAWWDSFSARPLAKRTRVSDRDALSLTAFYRGVTLIASTIASLPLHVYQEGPDGEGVKVKTPETRYLWGRPNVEETRQTTWEKALANEIRGNGYLWVEQDDVDNPIGVWSIDRKRVTPGRTRSGMKVYQVQGDNGTEVLIDYKQGGEIVHVPNWGDGLLGYDPVDLAQHALALGLSAEEYAASTFDNGQVPPGIITTEQQLTEEQAETLVKLWKKKHAGIKRAQEIGFLGNGAKFQQLSQDHEKMQMESLRRFQVQEIARLLGLPPHLLADVQRTTSWGSGIEEQNRGLIMFTLQAHINRFEQAINDNLLVTELSGLYCKLDLRGLLRGSTLQRFQAYRIADFMTVNEKRALEDLPPIEGGDVILQQVNQAPIDAFEDMQLGQQPPPADDEEDD